MISPPSPQRQREGRARRGPALKVFALAVSLLAVTGALVACTRQYHFGVVHPIGYSSLLCGVLVIMFVVVNIAPVSFHYRGETFAFVLAEVPLMIGLALVAPWQLVATRLAGGLIGFGLVRRQSPLKVVFNIAVVTCTAAVAAVIYHAALEHNLAVSPLGSAAGMAALASAAVVSQAAASLVVRLAGERVPRKTAFQVRTLVLLFLASAALALVVLDAAWFEWWAVVPLLVVGALIVFAYSGYARLTQRFSALERLYDFNNSIASLTQELSIVGWGVLQEVQVILRARRAQLFLLDPSGTVKWQSRVGMQQEAAPIPMPRNSVVSQALTGGPSLLRQKTPSAGQVPDPDPVLGDFRDALVVSMRNGEQVVGALVALDRDEALDTFDTDDLRLFEALAASAASTLERARLMEELRLEAESKIYQATHDLLTRLPNRSLFLTRAESALGQTGRAAVIMLDIDRFKDVNDTLGHNMGDRLLREVSERLVQAACGRATVARLGGDEFALVVAGIIGPEEAVGLVRDLHAAIARPIDIDGLPLAVSASTGIALAPEHGDNVTALLQRADIAMYIAKERRSGIELYTASDDQAMQRRLTLGGHLINALDHRVGLSVMYQPIADLLTGQVLRVEALSRWNHPEFGWVPAAEFIGIAEQMGIIGKVTEFVLSEACSQAGSWRKEGLHLGLAVNLSGRELSDERLVSLVEQHLEANDLPPHLLTLELTETEVMADLGEASEVLTQLANLGIRIAVDDYGTGYSSLAYLHRLPVQELKIDRSFVTNIVDDPSNRIIVRSSIAMAHSLGLSVVAEGAEDEVTCAVLADAGCDAVQGYYFSRPKTAGDLQGWLAGGVTLKFSRDVPPLRPLRVVADKIAEFTFAERGLGS